MSYEADFINDALTMRQVIEHYNVGTLRKNHIKCPFHNERTASFSVKGNIFKCFGCGVGGDIIKFVQMYFDLDFPGAIAKLDFDFNLGLGIGKKRTLRQVLTAKESQKVRAKKKQELTEASGRYWSAFDTWKNLDQIINNFAPKPGDINLDPQYIEAIKKIERAKYELDCAELDRQVKENAIN